MTVSREGMLDPLAQVGLGSAAAKLAGLPSPSVRPPIIQSPGLGAASGLGAAYELKFHIDPELASRIEHWAGSTLRPDDHGDRGRYAVTSVYCDTPALDVFHRSPGHRRVKFRLRRYDASSQAFLERKRKRGTQVIKRRTPIDADELANLGQRSQSTPWEGDWFLDRVRRRDLRPTACVNYRRTAFFGMAEGMPVRLTIDRNLIGIPNADWQIPHLHEGTSLLPDGVLLELKFHLHAPAIFRDLMTQLPSQLARVSKYRRCVSACGIGGILPNAGIDPSMPPDLIDGETR